MTEKAPSSTELGQHQLRAGFLRYELKTRSMSAPVQEFYEELLRESEEIIEAAKAALR